MVLQTYQRAEKGLKGHFEKNVKLMVEKAADWIDGSLWHFPTSGPLGLLRHGRKNEKSDGVN